MRATSLIAIFGLVLSPPVNGAPAAIQRIPLDAHMPVAVPVGSKTATTLQFPRPVQGVFGYGLTAGGAPGTYHYTHPPGSRLLVLRNLMPDKETFVTVLLGQEDLFVLHLHPSVEPPVGVYFLEPDARETARLARLVTPDEAGALRPDRSVARLFDLLRLGRNERVFRAALPQLYQGVKSRKVSFRSDDDRVATVVTDIHRFPKHDAIFLGGRIENSTGETQFFDPGALEVRVGKRTYPVILVDVAEEVPGGESIPVHVLIQGGVEGGRAHLSTDNDFHILMPEYADVPGGIARTGVGAPPAGSVLETDLEGGSK